MKVEVFNIYEVEENGDLFFMSSALDQSEMISQVIGLCCYNHDKGIPTNIQIREEEVDSEDLIYEYV